MQKKHWGSTCNTNWRQNIDEHWLFAEQRYGYHCDWGMPCDNPIGFEVDLSHFWRFLYPMSNLEQSSRCFVAIMFVLFAFFPSKKTYFCFLFTSITMILIYSNLVYVKVAKTEVRDSSLTSSLEFFVNNQQHKMTYLTMTISFIINHSHPYNLNVVLPNDCFNYCRVSGQVRHFR